MTALASAAATVDRAGAFATVERLRALQARDSDLARELHDGFSDALKHLDAVVAGRHIAPTARAARQLAALELAISSRLADTG